ncbi:MAG: sulfatase, partial [Bryobacter sp.]|nr:sulfatase [Bryobacter sp. CoA8 C33]
MRRRQFLASASAGLLSAQSKPRNIIFILTDDHRYDAMGFLKGQSFLETPHMDAMARNGVHAPNAFVTTALCSPSRASILTGQYAHKHRVVDNNNPIPPGTTYFPQLLQQQANYQTGFFGKWHMGGEGDDPQPGFDRWVSFRGQGTYSPSRNGLNIDGRRVPQKGYITDELTDYALDWLNHTNPSRPYFLYLSHKATHSEFEPAARHKGKFARANFVYPKSYAPPKPEQRVPLWVQNQRNSWHGVEYPYHSRLDIAEYYRRYAETLCAVDDSLGRVMSWLQSKNQLDSTLVVYMGDNGFAFGEHGLIDKRTAYEESMRVPLLLQCPELFGRGKKLNQVVANIDIAPTCLDAAGLTPPSSIQGRSFLPLAQGRQIPWRDGLLYEYYWERNFPQTPTIHALRGDRYKYVRYQGLWDLDELYDLQADPLEMQNLIDSPAHKSIALEMN